MAGILFTDGKTCLAGYNIKKNFISGIGGKSKEGETKFYTAIRETIEELFEIEPSKSMISMFEANLIKKEVLSCPVYETFVMSYDDLRQIIMLMGFTRINSNLYDKFPLDINELIKNRKTENAKEISHLLIVPIIHNLSFDHDFLCDIYSYKNSNI